MSNRKGRKLGTSVHSRAARRETSPGIDNDRSIKELSPAREREVLQPSVLAARAGAGVTKKASQRKSVLSARAKKRKEKGVDRAEAISARTSAKVEKSLESAKAMKVRRKTWDEVNTVLEGKEGSGRAAGANPFAALGGGEGSDDEEMEGEGEPLKAIVPEMVYTGEQEDEEIL